MYKSYKNILQGIAFLLFSVCCFLATPYLPNNGVSVLVGFFFSVVGFLFVFLSLFEKD